MQQQRVVAPEVDAPHCTCKKRETFGNTRLQRAARCKPGCLVAADNIKVACYSIIKETERISDAAAASCRARGGRAAAIPHARRGEVACLSAHATCAIVREAGPKKQIVSRWESNAGSSARFGCTSAEFCMTRAVSGAAAAAHPVARAARGGASYGCSGGCRCAINKPSWACWTHMFEGFARFGCRRTECASAARGGAGRRARRARNNP